MRSKALVLLLSSLAQDALKIDVFLTHQPSSTSPSNGTISGFVFVHCSSVTAFLVRCVRPTLGRPFDSGAKAVPYPLGQNLFVIRRCRLWENIHNTSDFRWIAEGRRYNSNVVILTVLMCNLATIN